MVDKEQEIGTCPLQALVCESDTDCTKSKYDLINIEDSTCESISTSSKACTIKQWCNPNTTATEVHYIQNIMQANVSINTFLTDDDLVLISGDISYGPSVYPDVNPSLFSLQDLLQIGGITDMSNLEDGAILSVKIIWNCEQQNETDCSKGIDVERLDQNFKGY